MNQTMKFPKVEKKDIPDEIIVRRVAHKIKIGDEIAYPEDYDVLRPERSFKVKTIEYIRSYGMIVFNCGEDSDYAVGINEMVELISGLLIEE